MLSSSLWWQDLRTTLLITVISVAVELALGMALALVMHRALVGRGIVRSSILVPYGIITVVAALAWKFAFTPGIGFINEWFNTDRAWLTAVRSLFVIILTEVWKTTPFMALLLLAGLALVPDGLLEAAKVDGATAWQAFRKVTLPLMKGAILVALLFRTLDAFRIFDTIYIQTAGREQHRERLDPRVQPAAQSAEPRDRFRGLRPDLPLCRRDRRRLREGVRREPRPATGGAVMAAPGERKLGWGVGLPGRRVLRVAARGVDHLAVPEEVRAISTTAISSRTP